MMEWCMRKEFFRYVYSPAIATLFVVFGVLWGAVLWGVVGWLLLQPEIWKSATTLYAALASVVPIVIFWIVWMAMTISARSPRWRERSKTYPLLIIDDCGLWFQEIGELMPWTEIKSIKFDRYGEDEPFDIVCKHPHPFPLSVADKCYWQGDENLAFRVGIRLGYMDRDGVLWRPGSIHKVMMECWERGCNAVL
jgi:hypothetical protein